MLPKVLDGKHHDVKERIHLNELVSRAIQERPADISTKKIRVVCRDCNNGWMNRIEGAARPILEPLIAGNPTMLNEHQQRILAEWITLKVMVAEHNNPVGVVIPQANRDAFRNHRTIPASFSIWVAKHNIYYWHSACAVASTALGPPPSHPPPYRPNVQTTALGVGALFVYVMVSDPGRANLNDCIRIKENTLSQISPISSANVRWGAVILSGTAPRDIANSLNQYVATKVTPWPSPAIGS